MSDKKSKAPKAGERAKGAKQDPIQNQAKNVSHSRRQKASFDTFFALYSEFKIPVTGKVGRTLRRLATAGEYGISSAEFVTVVFRLVAYAYLQRQMLGILSAMERVQNGRGWQGRYKMNFIVAILDTIQPK